MNCLKRALLVLVFPVLTLVATAPSVSAVEVGEKAPEFELRSTMGGKLKLSSLRGKNVLVQFYVLDFTPG
jgi:peroxiredoxin